MKEYYTEFQVEKDIPGGTFSIPIDMESFLELLEEAARSKEKMSWITQPWGIEFHIKETIIGSIVFFEKEEEK